MIPKPEAVCRGCVLWGTGHGFSLNDVGTNGILLLGEALGEEEEHFGRPFRGRAGRYLDRLIERTPDPITNAPLRRSDFSVTNCLRCQPPGDALTDAPYEFEALRQCRTHLLQSFDTLKPRVIFAMGNQALRATTGHWGIEQFRGYIFETPYGPVVPSFHPSFLLRGKHQWSRIFIDDLRKAAYIAREGLKPFTRAVNYILHPSATEVREFIAAFRAAGPEALLAFDIETPEGESEEKDQEVTAMEDLPDYQILRISFAFEDTRGITMPWIEPYSSLARELLATAPTLTGWNSEAFDLPRLRANGAEINGAHLDGMWGWKCLEPSFPMSLACATTFFRPDIRAWKHLSVEQPEYYSVVDSCAALSNMKGIRRGLQEQGRWAMFVRQFVEVGAVLRKASRRGVATDSALREEGRKYFDRRYSVAVEALQPLIPDEIKPKKVYKSSEESLRKKGLWEEGRMQVVQEEIEVKEGYEVKDGWLIRKVKEKQRRKSRGSRASSRVKDASLPIVPPETIP